MNAIFDLDGTLTDPRKGILACFKHALQELNARIPSDSELERFIGPPLQESFATLLGNTDRVAEAISLYRTRFASKGMFENKLYPGIAEALAQLRMQGVPLFVATAKPRIFATRIVEHFALAPFIHAVYGSELDGANADKRDLLDHLLRTESLSAATTVMVGDRALDIAAAKENGVFSVGVLWGYGSREELISAGADSLCEEPRSLLDAVSEMNINRNHSIRTPSSAGLK